MKNRSARLVIRILFLFFTILMTPVLCSAISEYTTAWVSYYSATLIRPMIFDDTPTDFSTSLWFFSWHRIAYGADMARFGPRWHVTNAFIEIILKHPWKYVRVFEIYSVVFGGGILVMLLWSKWLEHRKGLHDKASFVDGQQWSLLDRFSRAALPVVYGLVPVWIFLWTGYRCVSWLIETVIPYKWSIVRYAYRFLFYQRLSGVDTYFDTLIQYCPLLLLAWVFAHAPAVVRTQIARRLAANPLLCRCGYTTVNGKCPECGKPWRWIRRSGRLSWLRATRLRRLRRFARRAFIPLAALILIHDCTYFASANHADHC